MMETIWTILIAWIFLIIGIFVGVLIYHVKTKNNVKNPNYKLKLTSDELEANKGRLSIIEINDKDYEKPDIIQAVITEWTECLTYIKLDKPPIEKYGVSYIEAILELAPCAINGSRTKV